MLVWTADRRTELGGLWLEGLGGREIARRMRATPQAVINRAGRMGLGIGAHRASFRSILTIATPSGWMPPWQTR